MSTELVTHSLDTPIKVKRAEMIDGFTAPQITSLQLENVSEENNENSAESNKLPINTRVTTLLESNFMVIIMNIATIYALFGDDIKTLGFPKSADDVFSSLVVICLFLFLSELLLSFIFKPGYKWSFYFWLDLIATLSLVTDIGWIWDSALGLDSGNSDTGSLQAAGKASRAGTKTARALRIIRIVRLIRIVKLYKNAKIALEKKNKNEDEDDLFKDLPISKESQVGKQMSEVTMRRVIIIVLTLLFILPLFDMDFYYSAQNSWEFGLNELYEFYNQAGFDTVKDKYISYHKNDIRPIVYLKYIVHDVEYEWETSPGFSELRYNEIFYAATNGFVSVFDIRYDTKLTSLLNIIRTIFICAVLTLGSIYFSKDSEDLVIKPIEKMIQKVKIIAKNPIAAGDIQEMSKNEEKVVEKKGIFRICCKNSNGQVEFETQLLENTIVKIGVLLALGFGEAGSLIIGSNIERGGEVDPMIEGNKIVGIYGFCDIRNFTDTTEELQEGVMMFVNEIAQVVHGVVDKYLGAANKNIGDAFLLVWKFSNDDFYLNEDQIIRNPDSLRAKYLPDLSLLSFLKILAKVNKDPAMLKYRTNTKLLARMPGYEIKMGFGLHLGSSIEGAIGSQFKIDASYLSPNVNVASALEGSTKIYGVPLLISETLYNTFSEPIKKYCRQIDSVLIKGHSKAIALYTSDCDLSEFSQGKQSDRSKKFFRDKRKALKRDLHKGKTSTEILYRDSNELKLMRKNFNDEFFTEFQIGLNSYIGGYWINAKNQLEKVLKIRNKDGPTQALLSYMAEYGFQSPSSWKGVRYLM